MKPIALLTALLLACVACSPDGAHAANCNACFNNQALVAVPPQPVNPFGFVVAAQPYPVGPNILAVPPVVQPGQFILLGANDFRHRGFNVLNAATVVERRGLFGRRVTVTRFR